MISFGDGAYDAFRTIVSRIPVGYNIAAGSDTEVEATIASGTFDPRIDIRFILADTVGIRYRPLNQDGEAVGIEVYIKAWEDIERIHVY